MKHRSIVGLVFRMAILQQGCANAVDAGTDSEVVSGEAAIRNGTLAPAPASRTGVQKAIVRLNGCTGPLILRKTRATTTLWVLAGDTTIALHSGECVTKFECDQDSQAELNPPRVSPPSGNSSGS